MYEFDKCVIEKADGDYITWGNVIDYVSGKMRIKVNSDFGSEEIQGLTVYIYDSVQGECKFKADTYKINDKIITIINLKQLSSVQKRSNTRVNKRLDYKITHMYNDDELIHLEKPLNIMILNVSAVGLYFNCEEDLPVGYRFQLVFCETLKVILIEVEVIRKEDFKRSFNYGCIFRNLSNKDMDEIFRFVLKEQIEQRRKNLHL